MKTNLCEKLELIARVRDYKTHTSL